MTRVPDHDAALSSSDRPCVCMFTVQLVKRDKNLI